MADCKVERSDLKLVQLHENIAHSKLVESMHVPRVGARVARGEGRRILTVVEREYFKILSLINDNNSNGRHDGRKFYEPS